MLKDKQAARVALDKMESAHKLLMESLSFVKANCPDDEYKAYRSGMSQVLGQLFFLVMEPIYQHHPSLAPADTPEEFVKRWTEAAKGS